MTTARQDDAFGRDFLEGVVVWITENMEPDEVFTEEALGGWALNNGYIKEEDE